MITLETAYKIKEVKIVSQCGEPDTILFYPMCGYDWAIKKHWWNKYTYIVEYGYFAMNEGKITAYIKPDDDKDWMHEAPLYFDTIDKAKELIEKYKKQQGDMLASKVKDECQKKLSENKRKGVLFQDNIKIHDC